MSFTTELQKSYADHMYRKRIKPWIPVATSFMRPHAPIRSGLLRDNTYCYLESVSNDEFAYIRFTANPPRTPRYKGHSRKGKRNTTGDFGSAHAQFSNANHRISGRPMRSTGWWDKAVKAGLKAFGY